LVLFYANCIRHNPTPAPTFKNTTPFLTHHNHNNHLTRYEPKLPLCSPNSSNATTTTLATSSHSDDSFSRDSSLTNSSDLLVRKVNRYGPVHPQQQHFYHNFTDNVSSQCHCTADSNDIFQFIEGPIEASSRLPSRQNVFCISSPDQNEAHIYHEINTPMRFSPKTYCMDYLVGQQLANKATVKRQCLVDSLGNGMLV